MGIKVMHNGEVAFEVETLSQALALRRGLTEQPPEAPLPPKRKANPRNSPVASDSSSDSIRRAVNLREFAESVMSATATVGPVSMEILKALQEIRLGEKPWSMDKLAEWLKLETSKSLPPIMMQFRKDVDRLGLPFDEVISRKVVYTGGRKYSLYSPGPRAQEALAIALAREESSGGLFTPGFLAQGA